MCRVMSQVMSQSAVFLLGLGLGLGLGLLVKYFNSLTHDSFEL